MRVGFDASVAAGEPGGTGTYALQLLTALIPLRKDWTFVLYFRHPREANPLLTTPFDSRVRRAFVPGRPNGWRVQVALPRHLQEDGVDVYHSPGFFLPLRWPGRKVVTIHDLNIYRHARNWMRPRTFPAWLDLALQTPLSVRSAHRIITVSAASKHDLCRILHVPEARIRVIPEAPDPFFDQPAQGSEVAAALQIAGQPFVLFVGVLSPQKNLGYLVRAFAESGLARSGVNLVLAGRDESRYGLVLKAIARRLEIGDSLKLPGYVPRSTLRGLYASALCLVLPSHGEGFGLPLVEAMACGTPILAADRQAIPEVLNGAGSLFDPQDQLALAGLLKRVHEDERFRTELREHGRRRRKDFSWTRTAEATAQVYAELVNG